MAPSELDKTFVDPAKSASSADGLTPVELADVLLAALCKRAANALTLERLDDKYVVRAELVDGVRTLASVNRALGEAVLARLAVIAGLPLRAEEERMGRLKVAVGEGAEALKGAAPSELLLVLKPSANGSSAELQRMAGRADVRASVVPPAAGNRVGAYELQGELGRGGMGVVHRALHVALQKQVALKMLSPGIADDPELAARFLVEARAACRARDPAIVDVTDFGWLPDGRGYLVMELIDWPTLDKAIAGGPLPGERALKIAAGIVRAVRAASARGVVHRDLKPENIFVGDQDQVKVSDFGLARLSAGSGTNSQARGVLGTSWYISPEQIRAEPVDLRSDLYAVGCILFEMLTGAPPFDGGNVAAILDQHLNAPLPTVGVPELTGRVLLRATAKRREDRYQTAEEMLADIELALRPPLLSAFTEEGGT